MERLLYDGRFDHWLGVVQFLVFLLHLVFTTIPEKTSSFVFEPKLFDRHGVHDA